MGNADLIGVICDDAVVLVPQVTWDVVKRDQLTLETLAHNPGISAAWEGAVVVDTPYNETSSVPPLVRRFITGYHKLT